MYLKEFNVIFFGDTRAFFVLNETQDGKQCAILGVMR
jgi:hypothetical protein